jgi:hypothetical protein
MGAGGDMPSLRRRHLPVLALAVAVAIAIAIAVVAAVRVPGARRG